MFEEVWVLANHCMPSTLYQFLIQWISKKILIQWVSDDVENVVVDASTCVAMVYSLVWTDDDVNYLMSLDLPYYDFLSVFRYGFVPVSVKRNGFFNVVLVEKKKAPIRQECALILEI
jgi:hypothetical protein